VVVSDGVSYYVELKTTVQFCNKFYYFSRMSASWHLILTTGFR